jgi:proline iminopeptidase
MTVGLMARRLVKGSETPILRALQASLGSRLQARANLLQTSVWECAVAAHLGGLVRSPTTEEFSTETPDGVRLKGWTIGGSGPPLVGLHGGLGLDASYLAPALEPVSARAAVVAFDQRGHGRSSGRESLATASLVTFARDVDAVRDGLGAERLVLFGHSYGGFIALEYALRFPERIAGLVLCATSASLSHLGGAMDRVASLSRPEELTALTELLSAPPESDEAFGEKWCTITPLYFRDHQLSRRHLFQRTCFSAAGYAASARCLSEYDVAGRLHEIKAPTLLLHGAHDWLMPSAVAGAELGEGIRHSTRVTFEESAHYPFIEEPEPWARAVSKWLESIE